MRYAVLVPDPQAPKALLLESADGTALQLASVDKIPVNTAVSTPYHAMCEGRRARRVWTCFIYEQCTLVQINQDS